MFVELAKLSTHAQIKIIVTGVSDGKLNLIIEPKSLKGDEKSPFTSPLCLTATPEELDAELPAYLTQFTDRTKSLFAQFEEQMSNIEIEAKESSEKAKISVAKKGATTPTTSKTITKSETSSSKAKADEQEKDMLSLF